MLEPRRFVKFLLDNFDLIEVIAARYSRFTRAEFAELNQEHSTDDLVQKGLLNYTPETLCYSLHPTVRQLFLELTRQRHLSGGHIIKHHVRTLESILESLDRHLRTRQWFFFEEELDSLHRALENINADVRGNLDVIRRQTSDYRCNPLGSLGSAKQRLKTLGIIWDNQIQPLGDVFVPQGPVDEILVQIGDLLRRAETIAAGKPEAASNMRHAFYRARALTRSAAEAHREAIREVKPLHDAARRNERVATAASALISGCFENRPCAAPLYADRKPGLPHVLDAIFAIQTTANDGEDRFFTPFPTEEAKTMMVDRFFGYRPSEPPVIQWARQVEMPFVLTDGMVRHKLKAAMDEGPVEDLMAWLIETFPKASLKDVVRAYGWIVMKWGGRSNPALDVVNRKGGFRLESHPVDSRRVLIRSFS